MQNNIFRFLALGDVVSHKAVDRVACLLPQMRKDTQADFIAVNGENSSDINGLDKYSASALLDAGADVITGGNHTLTLKEIHSTLEESIRLLRPANYPPLCPGNGSTLLYSANGLRVLMMNVSGQVFTSPCDNPFVCCERILGHYKGKYDLAFCDFHGEATSEKIAFGNCFDGRINCIYGTHTHVPTADECVLPKGSGYITDIGMCGIRDNSVLGLKSELIVKQYVTGVHQKFVRVTSGNVEINGVLFEYDVSAKRCVSVKRISYK